MDERVDEPVGRQEGAPELPALTAGQRSALTLKRLVLIFGAAYLGFVCLTNTVNLVNAVAGTHSRFLNSQNASYVASVVKVYALPGWFDNLAVLGAAIIEGLGAWLFIRALRRFHGDGSGVTEAYQALTWNIAVWFAFIVGTELFVAYPSESPFREPLGLGFLMALLITLVPDAPAGGSPAVPLDPGER